jgi:transposase-like protein
LELFEGVRLDENRSLVDELMERALAYFVTKALEEEVTDWLGRDHYQRGRGKRKGHRNGYDDASIKTEAGRVRVKKPKLRNGESRFISRLWGFIRRGSERLRRRVIEMYVRGLSTRDIEDLFRDERGVRLLSRSAVSEITEVVWEDYERFRKRDLSRFQLEYLFLDAIYESVRRECPGCEGILVAWGITSDGEKVILDLVLGSKESEEAWLDFLRDMVRRGLDIPLLITADGAPGLIKAIERVFPHSDRQRCLAHKIRNILTKVPEAVRPEVKTMVQGVYYAGDERVARLLAQELDRKYRSRFPSAVACFWRDFDACIVYMRYPRRHHRHIRTTNLLERSFLEEKRRTKVIPGFFTEKSTLKLVFGVLVRVQYRWRRIPMGREERQQLIRIRKEKGLLRSKQESA